MRGVMMAKRAAKFICFRELCLVMCCEDGE